MGVDTDRIRRLELFASLDEAELAEAAAVVEQRVAEPGEPVAAEADFGHAVFAIEDGAVDIIQDGAPIRRLGAGDVFGEIALFKSGRRTASAVAASECRLLVWFKRDVFRLERSAPGFAQALRDLADARLAADS